MIGTRPRLSHSLSGSCRQAGRRCISPRDTGTGPARTHPRRLHLQHEQEKKELLIKLELERARGAKWDFHVRQTRPTACREIDLSGARGT